MFWNRKEKQQEEIVKKTIKIRNGRRKDQYLLQIEMMTLESVKIIGMVKENNLEEEIIFEYHESEQALLDEILERFNNNGFGKLDNFIEKKLKRKQLIKAYSVVVEESTDMLDFMNKI